MSRYDVDDQTEMSIASRNALRRLSEYWWIFLIQGIAAIILGFLLLTNPAATAVSLVVFLGAYWLVSGVMDFVRLFTDSGQWGWHLALGVLGVLSGILVLRHPLISTVATGAFLVTLLGVGSIVMGVVGIIRGIKEDGWGSIAIGVVNLLIGFWLLFNPLSAAIALPITLGIFALVGGVSTIINSFKLKNLTI
ncbi:MAG TPA: HdeD family acid-resistance protein [Leptolyngbyaceae cyanobacterium M33_DOE_097]|uniref:HdeD family acid-resistance protein n=1 Tax=Oscillatoriales cyanobacterium SpSt-418 TaxID=2282169 RepID=A0A7C3KCI1_9CYAN|nr:HdeD family acid-resistance protein [Leptolyngbyaceae cyanobacterium M33_DOE_097]